MACGHAAAASRDERFINASLSFEQNLGPSTVEFLARGPGYALFLSPERLVLNLSAGNADNVGMTLIGANAQAEAVELDRQPGVVSYFIGNDPKKWRTGIPTYGKVNYAGIYRGIDLVYYGNQRQLEFDFIVAPGADPSSIVWRIDGARPGIDGNGNLTLNAANGPVTLRKPVVYQVDGDRKIPVEGSFALAKDRVGFRIGSYDHSRELVIDPVLSYATYLAGSSSDYIGNTLGPGATDNLSQGLAVDSAGSIYVTGYTSSVDFPTANAKQKTFPSSNTNSPSTFVTKFSPDGSSLVYSTYLGGSSGDQAYAIAVDAAGEAYITGLARSPDFPITNGAYQAVCAPLPTDTPSLLQTGCPGETDAFLTKLNAQGTGLVYSTFLGGYGPAYATAIAVDSAGRAYIAGDEWETCQNHYAFHSCFPTTDNPVIAGDAPTADAAPFAFVAVFDPSGAHLLYSTLFGDLNVTCPAGCGLTRATGVAVDSTGAFYLIGFTQAGKLPTTPGVIQPTGAPLDASGVYVTAYRGYIAKFSPVTSSSSASLTWATYLGGTIGNEGDFLSGIAIDSSNNIYVGGLTNSSDFPVTSGAYQTACGTQGESCGANHVTKINPTGTAILWSTYLGNARADGSDNIESCGPIQLDGAGNVYIIGLARSDFPKVNAVEPMALSNTTGVVVAELDPTGSQLLFSSPVGSGGLDPEFPGGLAVDQAGNIYVAGNDQGSNLITTPGVFQPSIAADHCCYHGYVAKITGGPAVKSATAGQIEPFAAESIVAAYGSGLASQTDTATTQPLPTSLDNNSVTVTDSAGTARPAPLFYISSSQINFEIPAGVATGNATVMFQNANGTAQSSAIQIGKVSPGIFQLDSAALVAAWVLPVINGAQQPLLPVYQVLNGSLAPLPINVSSATEQFYLEIYGTGFRNAKSITATAGNLSVPVLGWAAAPGYVGLDQVNIGPLPTALTGQGSVNIQLTADGVQANVVTVSMQ